MNHREGDLDCCKNMDDYRRLQLLRDDETLCERSFSLIDKRQVGECEEMETLLRRLKCDYKKIHLGGEEMVFLFVSKSDMALVNDPSRRSTIKRILQRVLGGR